ncbi:MAG: DUF1800 domain-containing protein [Burkholderiales bacterium]|nr:DUF1800 domain-containing protein [Burkholderiales bacterium]
MKRRTFIASGGVGLAAPAWLWGCAAAPATGSPVPVEAHGNDIAFLNRVTWGVDSAAVAALQRLSRRDYLQAQLHPARTPALPAEVQVQIDRLRLRQKPMEVWVPEMQQRRRELQALEEDETKKAAQQAYQQDMNGLARDAATQMLLHALYSPSQLHEQLTWFWFNHFNVHQHKGDLRAMVGDYEGVLRAHALGRFRDLLIASATHAAMIRYLDNEQNAVNRVNENFAREIMELHTLGVDGGYAQKDVQELARVLTGLGVNFTDRTPNLRPALQALYLRHGATEFNPARHDMGDKLVLGQSVARQGWSEIIDQLTRLARHPATARHVCGKLAMYLVADRPPPALVDRMSRSFLATDGNIALTLQALFDAPEFGPSLTHKFKDPMHYVVSAVRLAYDGKPILNAAPMLGWLNRLGQGLYNRPTPDGYPMDEAAWSSSGQMATRFEIARAIGSGSAGLFRVEGSTTGERPTFAQLSNALYHASLASTLGARTRSALDNASSPLEWNALLLSSPEFMFR